MSGKWRFVMAIGDFSIALAQTGMIPLREAARGNTPVPSNRRPNLREHIDRLSACFGFISVKADGEKGCAFYRFKGLRTMQTKKS